MEIKTQLVLVECGAQIAQHLETLLYGKVEIFGIITHRVAAFFFGAVKGDVGVFENLARFHTVVRAVRDTDGYAYLKTLVQDADGLCHGVENAVNQRGGVGVVFFQNNHGRKFVGAGAGNERAGGQRLHETLADGFQKLVAEFMTHRVVDVLEMVKVDGEYGEAALFFRHAVANVVVQFFKEESPVGQAGQVIVIGQLVNAVFGLRAQFAQVMCVLADKVVGDAQRDADFITGFAAGAAYIRFFRVLRGAQQVVAQNHHRLQKPLAEHQHQNAGHQPR